MHCLNMFESWFFDNTNIFMNLKIYKRTLYEFTKNKKNINK